MIAVIGATGKLGRALLQKPNTIVCPVRFEDAEDYQQWFDDNPDVDTVWHVARACRKTGVRRDYKTFTLEKTAMKKLLQTRASACRFVYASTKVVYGIVNESTPLSAGTTSESFDEGNGIENFPAWKQSTSIDISGLGKEHKIYALTKLVCEKIIKDNCKNYKIIRIWDII